MLELLFPRRCLLCGGIPSDSHEDLCGECFDNIQLLPSPHCSCCAKPFESSEGGDHLCGNCIERPKAFERLFTGGAYTKTLRELIHLGKFSEREETIRPLLRFFLQREQNNFFPKHYDLLLCIPTTPRRLRKRGLHLAARVTRSLGKIYHRPFDLFALKKVRETPPQSELKGEERWTNVRNAFQIEGDSIRQARKVLLIDDVYTTGATLHEGTRVLKKAGVSKVDVLTLVRGV